MWYTHNCLEFPQRLCGIYRILLKFPQGTVCGIHIIVLEFHHGSVCGIHNCAGVHSLNIMPFS